MNKEYLATLESHLKLSLKIIQTLINQELIEEEWEKQLSLDLTQK